MATYKCPQCGSQNLSVAVTVDVVLVQFEDNQETEYNGGDHEWGNNSQMTCGDCQHHALAGDFIPLTIEHITIQFSTGETSEWKSSPTAAIASLLRSLATQFEEDGIVEEIFDTDGSLLGAVSIISAEVEEE